MPGACGIDFEHRDLNAAVQEHYDYISDASTTATVDSSLTVAGQAENEVIGEIHGTAVAGLIAARSGKRGRSYFHRPYVSLG